MKITFYNNLDETSDERGPFEDCQMTYLVLYVNGGQLLALWDSDADRWMLDGVEFTDFVVS